MLSTSVIYLQPRNHQSLGSRVWNKNLLCQPYFSKLRFFFSNKPSSLQLFLLSLSSTLFFCSLPSVLFLFFPLFFVLSLLFPYFFFPFFLCFPPVYVLSLSQSLLSPSSLILLSCLFPIFLSSLTQIRLLQVLCAESRIPHFQARSSTQTSFLSQKQHILPKFTSRFLRKSARRKFTPWINILKHSALGSRAFVPGPVKTGSSCKSQMNLPRF